MDSFINLIIHSKIQHLTFTFKHISTTSLFEALEKNKTINELKIYVISTTEDPSIHFIGKNNSIKILTLSGCKNSSKILSEGMKENNSIIELNFDSLGDFSFLKHNKTMKKLTLDGFCFVKFLTFFSIF